MDDNKTTTAVSLSTHAPNGTLATDLITSDEAEKMTSDKEQNHAVAATTTVDAQQQVKPPELENAPSMERDGLEPHRQNSVASDYGEQQRKKQQLLSNLKRHTKHLMEEAVTKKSVHEDSSSVTYFTAAIDECLSYGLKRRALGLFRSTTSTLALIQKLAKNNFEPARIVLNALHQFEREQQVEYADSSNSSSLSSSINVVKNWTSSLASMSAYRRPLSIGDQQQQSHNNSPTTAALGFLNRSSSVKRTAAQPSYFGVIRGSGMHMSDPNSVNKLKKPPAVVKYMWVRLALFEKVLDKIVQLLVENASKYYAEHSLVGDPCEGSVFASLVAGPCSIDFVRCRVDIETSDLSADELVSRHRIHSPYMSYQVSNCSLPPTAAHAHVRRQSINYTGVRTPKTQDSLSSGLPSISNSLTHFFSNNGTNGTNGSDPSLDNSGDASMRDHLDMLMNGPPTAASGARSSAVAKGYVDSIHQNIRETLLYGKNNVKMQLSEGQPLPGYLSLHLINGSERELILKWSPNRLMENHGSGGIAAAVDVAEKSTWWEMAQSIDMSDIFSIHCHQSRASSAAGRNGCEAAAAAASESTIVMVGADGVSTSPIHFAPGGHLLNFLSCLQQGLHEVGDSLEPSLAAMQKEFNEEQHKQQHNKVDDEFADNNQANNNNDDEVRLGSDSTINGSAEEDAAKKQSSSSSDYLFCIVHNNNNHHHHHNEMSNNSTESVFGSLEENGVLMNGHGPLPTSFNDELRNGSSSKTPSSSIIKKPSAKTPHVGKPIPVSPLSRESINSTAVPPHSAASGFATLPRFSQMSTTSIESTTSCITINSFSSGYMSTASGGNSAMCTSPLAFVQSKNLLADSASRTMSLQTACEGMRRQILTRAFYGWLSHCRYIRTLRTKLAHIVHSGVVDEQCPQDASAGLTPEKWQELSSHKTTHGNNKLKMCYYVYYGGISDKAVRKQCWPYLLNHCAWSDTDEQIAHKNELVRAEYEDAMTHWMAADVVIQQRERELMNKYTARLQQPSPAALLQAQTNTATQNGDVSKHKNEAAIENNSSKSAKPSKNVKQTSFFGELADIIVDRISAVTSSSSTATTNAKPPQQQQQNDMKTQNNLANGHITQKAATSPAEQEDIKMSPLETTLPMAKALSEDRSFTALCNGFSATSKPPFERSQSIVVYDSDEYGPCAYYNTTKAMKQRRSGSLDEQSEIGSAVRRESDGIVFFANSTADDENHNTAAPTSQHQIASKAKKFLPPHLQAVCNATGTRPSIDSVTSSTGLEHDITYKTQEFAENVHRIDKDVARCDRAHPYFASSMKNLGKLRNIMCTYVWLNPQEGYVQGMCDLAAPLLVTFDDEPLTFSCFRQLMKRMSANFPGHSDAGAMDRHFMNMRSLTQLLDAELFEVMRTKGDYTHFFFCYRWFLLDFKREFAYKDIFRVWESIWAAERLCSSEFPIFIALAMLQCYRDIIIENNMDFTEVIKFFNEMAERHDGETVLKVARDLVHRLQTLVRVEVAQQQQQQQADCRTCVNSINDDDDNDGDINVDVVVAADDNPNCDSSNVRATNDNNVDDDDGVCCGSDGEEGQESKVKRDSPLEKT